MTDVREWPTAVQIVNAAHEARRRQERRDALMEKIDRFLAEESE